MEERKYDAFISYRHSELDRFVAEKIQKRLETYKLPKNVKRNIEGAQKTKIARVFRDKDELPLTNDLSQPIMSALQNTEYLIVICSPRIRESMWCQREIESFIAMHDRNHILAVLAEGEPEEAFPDALQFYEEEVTNPDGSITKRRVNLEPLAADARGKNKREIEKNIQTESLRLMAPMFGVAFDDLKQRHRERKLKRIIGATALGAAFCILFGAISGTMALQIRTQALALEEQSKELQESNELLEVQYRETMSSNEAKTAEEALHLAACGAREDALEMLIDVMPQSSEDTTIPYVAQTQYALTDILGAYDCGGDLKGTFQITCDSIAVDVVASPEEDYILVSDALKNLYLYNAETEERVMKKTLNCDMENLEHTYGFVSDTSVYYYTDNEITIYDYIEDTEYILECPKDMSDNDKYKDIVYYNGYIAAFRANEIFVWNTNDGDLVCCKSVGEDGNTCYATKLYFSFEGERIICTYYCGTDIDSNEGSVEILDLNSEEIIYQQKFRVDIIRAAQLQENTLYLATSMYESSYIEGETTIIAITIDSDETIWTQTIASMKLQSMELVKEWTQRRLCLVGRTGIYFLDPLNGEVVNASTFPSMIVDYWFKLGVDGATVIIDNEGNYYCLYEGEGGRFGPYTYIQPENEKFVKMINPQNYVAAIEEDSRTVGIYTNIYGQKASVIDESNLNWFCVSASGNYAAGFDCDEYAVKLYNIQDKDDISTLTITEINHTPIKMFFTEDEEYLVVLDNSLFGDCYIINVEDGSIEKQYSIESMESLTETYVNREGSIAIFYTDSKWIYLDVFSGEVTENINHLGGLDFSSIFSFDYNMTTMALLNNEENIIEIRNLDNDELINTINTNSAFVDSIYLSENAEVLMVAYLDQTVEIFEVESGESKVKLTVNSEVADGITYNPSNSEYTIICSSESYVLNNEFQLIARIAYYCGYSLNNDSYFIYANELCMVPHYSYDDLIEEAEEVVED